MKNIFALAAICSFMSLSAQNIGVNAHGQIPHPSAIFDVSDSGSVDRKGILIPRMTTAMKNTIVSPEPGLIVYDTTIWCFSVYGGTIWIDYCQTPTSPSCPPGMVDVDGHLSIDLDERSSLGWWPDAIAACHTIGARLCSPEEWIIACQSGVPLNNMLDGWEWTSTTYGSNVTTVGQGYCENLGSISANSPFIFRCCCMH